MYNKIQMQFEMIFEGEITNETTLQLATALADLGEATSPPDDGSTLYAQVYDNSVRVYENNMQELQ